MKTTTMTFDEFKTAVAQSILDYLPDGYNIARVRIESVQKSNGMYDGLIISRPGIAVAPSVNLNGFYGKLQEGNSFESVMESIADTVQVAFPGNVDAVKDMLLDWNAVKSKLFVKVCNAELRKDYLKDLPHKIVAEDLALTANILVDRTNGISSVTVSNDLLEYYDISIDTLFDAAMESTVKVMPVKLQNMSDILHKHDIPDGANGLASGIYIVSTDAGVCGAAAIFYPDVLKALYIMMGLPLCIIPSSIHEVLVMPYPDSCDGLNSTILDTNASCMSEGERLSTHAYCFDGTKLSWISGT